MSQTHKCYCNTVPIQYLSSDSVFTSLLDGFSSESSLLLELLLLVIVVLASTSFRIFSEGSSSVHCTAVFRLLERYSVTALLRNSSFSSADQFLSLHLIIMTSFTVLCYIDKRRSERIISALRKNAQLLNLIQKKSRQAVICMGFFAVCLDFPCLVCVLYL